MEVVLAVGTTSRRSFLISHASAIISASASESAGVSFMLMLIAADGAHAIDLLFKECD